LLTLRHLLSHQGGFPEDNPWGDRQLSVSDATLASWMQAGIPFSNPPGVAYEYSNYGFAILGRVVSRASGRPYREYIDREILGPLGMTSTFWEEAAVPKERVAKGQGRDGERWVPEQPLEDGAFGAMGGLYSSVPDLARYVAFYLSAYPPRDDAEAGPVRRASLRLMQTPASPYRASARRESLDGPLVLSAGGYAFGLAVAQTCGFGHSVSHGGGLPGFGSTMRWLPEHGVGIVALANRTYAGPGRPVADAFEALAKTGGLAPRRPQPARALLDAQATVNRLYADWSDDTLRGAAADNLLLDRPLDRRRTEFAELRERHGACRADGDAGAIEVENALRGRWTLACERGEVRIAITLAPTPQPRVQHLQATSILPLGPRLGGLAAALASRIAASPAPPLGDLLAPGADPAPLAHAVAAAGAWGPCRVGAVRRGGGDASATVRFECRKGPLDASLAIDEPSGRLKTATLVPGAGETCVP
jgi:CubicO group peptidase (beta-lactamase class C family)